MAPVLKATLSSCLVVGLFACGALGPGHVIVYQDPQFTVSVVPDPSVDTAKPSTLHDHPARIRTDQVFGILREITVERSRGLLVSMVLGTQREPGFSREELTILAPQVSAGLARASSRDRVSVIVSRAVNAKTPEVLEWAVWIHSETLHVQLVRHQVASSRQQSELKSTLEGAATRGPGVSRDLPGDLTVGFAYPEYLVAVEPSPATELFGNPHAHVAIDYRRFLSTPSPKALSSERTASSSVAGQGSHIQREPEVSKAADETSVINAGGDRPSNDVQAVAERVKTLEAQVNDLLGVVKQLTKELAESNRALTARDEEIRSLKKQVKPAERQRKPRAP